MRSVESRNIKGLRGFADTLKSGKSVTERYTYKQVNVDLEPTSYGAKEVRAVRDMLNASQAVFAKFLGVSAGTVRAWEQGINPPKDMACRFLDEISLHPELYKKRLLESITVKRSRKANKGC